METTRAPSKNKPCPCGSGQKYKRCCMPDDDFGDGDSGHSGGFAAEIGRFAQPLLDLTDGSQAQIEKVMAVAMIAWNIGHAPRAQQEAEVDRLIAVTDIPEDTKADYRSTLWSMVEHFRQMYPGGP